MANSWLWDKEKGDKVIFSTKNRKWLQKQVPALMRQVCMQSIMEELVAHEVIDTLKRDRIVLLATNADQVSRLCDYLQVTSMWRWHAFLRCLVLTGQEAVLTTLGYDLEPYEGESIANLTGPPGTEEKYAPMSADTPAPNDNISKGAPPNNSGATCLPPWHPEHPDGELLLCEDDKLERKLNEELPILRKTVRIDDLWSNLVAYQVMNDEDIDNCKVGTTANQVEKVISFLKRDVVWRTHAFFRCLALINQDFLIDKVLGKGAKQNYQTD